MLLVKGWLFPAQAARTPDLRHRTLGGWGHAPGRWKAANPRPGLAMLYLACGLLAWLSADSGSSMAAGLAVTDSRHFTKGPRPAPRPFDARLSRPPPAPPNALPSSNLLYRRDDLRFSDFPYDRSLSRLCREGRFLQIRDRLFIARLGGQIYGAVVGGHWALRDPRGAALPGFIYAMHRQHTGRCEVRRIGPLSGQ